MLGSAARERHRPSAVLKSHRPENARVPGGADVGRRGAKMTLDITGIRVVNWREDLVRPNGRV